MRLRNLFLGATFSVWSLALVGASCDKKSIANPSEPPIADPEPAAAGKKGGGGKTGKAAPGVDLSKLDDAGKKRFNALIDKVQSPCGKSHSLRTSLETDTACKRALFAGRYVARLIWEDVPDEELQAFYSLRYQQQKTYTFKLAAAPYEGVPGAPVTIVEFFDYGCPACKAAVPLIEDLAAEYASELVIYYKHFPLAGHKDSVIAATAAVAAQKQGKFKQMHRKLFGSQDDHSKEALFKYAKEAGLDMKKFEAAYADEATRGRVLADKAEGEASDLEGTPTLYINGRMYSDPLDLTSLKDWIEEELAVNR